MQSYTNVVYTHSPVIHTYSHTHLQSYTHTVIHTYSYTHNNTHIQLYIQSYTNTAYTHSHKHKYSKKTYRVFQKKVPTFVLLISQLVNHLKEWFCTFFNSPVFAESKNNNILILGLKLEKLLTKMWWEDHIWNGEYWGLD